jgi:hypothetical protein
MVIASRYLHKLPLTIMLSLALMLTAFGCSTPDKELPVLA